VAEQDELIRNSVTKQDYERSVHSGGIGFGDGLMHILIGDTGLFGGRGTGLPGYWTPERDIALLATQRMCSIWPSVVNKAITKLIAPGFRIEDSDDSQRRTTAGQDLMNMADASSWIQFGFRHLQDVFLTDNGAMVEIIRSSSARGSKILGIMHLDSLRCKRTGFPDYPVLYTDDYGREHPIRAEDILMYSDQPSARAHMHGVGLCAADRAYDAIVKLASVETYFREKVTGNRALAIHIVSGISKAKLKSAMESADQEQEEKGFFVYKGSLVIPTMDTDKPPSVITIPLAEIPDGFVVTEERDSAYLEIVNAIGMPLQDVKPLSGQGLGTGTQTVILDEASEGQGPGAAWRAWWEYVTSFRLMAKTTTFHFATNDIRDQKAKAEVAQIRAGTRQQMVVTGEITPAQSLNMAVDAGDAPREFLPDDETPGGSLDNNEKETPDVADRQLLQTLLASPIAGGTVQPIQTLAQKQQPPQPAAPGSALGTQPRTKSVDTLAVYIGAIEQELSDANIQLA
jgi:hypothetical protein